MKKQKIILMKILEIILILSISLVTITGCEKKGEENKKDKIFRQYDKNTGELLSISSNSKGMNNATSFTYNYGLLTSMMHHGMKVSYTYDGQGRKTKVKIQNTPFINISYSDNVDINESSLSLKNANKVITTQNGYKVESLCDKNGQLRKQNLNDETSVLYTYDKKNRRIQTTFSDNTPNESIIYEEDKVKEITKGTFTHSYTYDEKDRILYEQEKENCGNLWVNSNRLFVTWNGKPMHPDTVTDWFRSFIEKNNLPKITFHGLRHTNATLLISKNVDVAVVASRLGHAQITTTLNFYVHPVEAHNKEAGNVLEKMLV